MKISHFLCNLKRVPKKIVVIMGISALMVLRDNVELQISTRGSASWRQRPHLILSGGNCTLEAGKMNVKTTKIWDSRVVKVMKHLFT